MKNNKTKTTKGPKETKKSKPKSVKPEITKEEQREITMQLLRVYAPLAGRNKVTLSRLTNRSISLINRYFRRDDFKDIKDLFEKQERVDHITEGRRIKFDKIKSNIPLCDGSYYSLSSLTGISKDMLCRTVNEPGNDELKMAMQERRREAKLQREKEFGDLIKESIVNRKGDIKQIAADICLSLTQTWRRLNDPGTPDIRSMWYEYRDKDKEQFTDTTEKPALPKGNPEFNIDSAKNSFLVHQQSFAYLPPDEAKHPALIGGYGSGKTMSVPLRWLKLIEFRKSQGKKCELMVIEPTTEMIQDIIVPAFDDFFYKLDIPVKYFSQKRNYTIEYGGEKHICLFRSAERPRSLTGKNLTDIILDEFERIPYYKQKQVWRECISRIRKAEHGTCAVVSTPEGYKLVHELWIEKANRRFRLIKAKTKDNFYLPEDYIDNLIEQYDSRLAKQYLEGDFVNIESDLAYYFFDRKTHVITDEKIPQAEHNTLILSFDFNVNPMCAVEIIMNGRTRYQVYEHKISNSNTKELCESIIASLQRRYKNPQELNLVLTGDASGAARSTAGDNSDFEIIQKAFKDAEYNHVTPAFRSSNPPVRERINYINALLERKQFFISEQCKASVKDRELVSWKKGSEKFVIDKSDRNVTHLSDAADYGLWASRYVNEQENKNPFVIIPHSLRRYS